MSMFSDYDVYNFVRNDRYEDRDRLILALKDKR